MNKRAWYSVELAAYYEEAAHDIAISGMPFDFDPIDLDEYERMEWLAEIWDEIAYCLHGKWHS